MTIALAFDEHETKLLGSELFKLNLTQTNSATVFIERLGELGPLLSLVRSFKILTKS
jgi:hypothetical protein